MVWPKIWPNFQRIKVISVRVVNDNGKIWLVAMSGLLAAFLIFGQTKGE